jgi:hypothetical protein
MKRWLLLLLIPIALLLLAAGALFLQSSGEAQAGAISGESVACAAIHTDALVSSVDSAGPSLGSDEALLAPSCYLARISRFPGGCGNQDLWIMRYLCYEAGGKGWYYVNYWYCV